MTLKLTTLKGKPPGQKGTVMFHYRFNWGRLASLNVRWQARAWFTNEIGSTVGRERPWIIRLAIRKWMNVYYRFFMA